MLSEILFYGVGIIGFFILGRIIFRQLKNKDKCSGCAIAGNCKKKGCK